MREPMAESLPSAEIVHAMPGRARLRIAERRGESAFFAAIATGLSALPGVSRVEVNPLTGGVLILHTVPLAQICQAAARERVFSFAGSAAESHSFSGLPALPVDPRLIGVAALGLLALWQLGRGKVLPQALTLAWYAAGLAGLLMASPLSTPQGETRLA